LKLAEIGGEKVDELISLIEALEEEGALSGLSVYLRVKR
jgi:hypothetical protein